MSSSTSFTYDELIAEIQLVLTEEGAEFVGDLQNVVRIGETRLATDLNFTIFDGIVTGTLTASQAVQTIKTATWQGTRSLYITVSGVDVFLQQRTYEYVKDFAPDPTVEGVPIYYAELNETDFYVGPTTDSNYPFTLRQIQAPDSLAPGNQNTWLGDNLGDILLASCLIWSEQWLKSEPEFIDKWKQDYAEKMPQRRAEARRLIRSEYSPVKQTASPAEG